jgi:uncharacterized membrane protein YjdF
LGIEWYGSSYALPVGAAFLVAQGDPWDAQHDMLAATCGTVVALLLTAGWQRLERREPGRDPGLSEAVL